MRLKIEEFEKIAMQKGYRTGNEFMKKLGGGKMTYSLLRQGKQIGYELVKDIYNELGENTITKVIDFEEETLDGFKAKYIICGNKLY